MSSLKLLNQDAEHAKRFVALAMNINAAKGLQVSSKCLNIHDGHVLPNFPRFFDVIDRLALISSSDKQTDWFLKGGAQVELGAERNIEDACWWLGRRKIDERWQDSSA